METKEGAMAQKLKRAINMGFRVNEDEKYFIDKKMEAAGWTNFRNFVLHCLVRGEIVRLDLGEIREMNTLLRNVSNNINQIAARANSTGSIYAADIAGIQARQKELWEQQSKILGAMGKIAEGK
jgi:hypothetical protein